MKKQSFYAVICLLLLFLCLPVLAEEYGAIAYSPSEVKYGYSHGFDSKTGAEAEAMARCPYEDARIIVWVKDGWAALARNPQTGKWSSGWSKNSQAEAEGIAQSGVEGPSEVLCWTKSFGEP